MSRDRSAVSGSSSGRDHTYFFLSYAHSAPISEDDSSEADPAVAAFFEDLSEAVAARAGRRGTTRTGYFDQQMSQGTDGKSATAAALGATEVFVPLCSPRYLINSWSLRELESFRQHLGASDAARHVTPVLWVPFPSWEATPEIDAARRLGEDIPGYLENGVRAMQRLSPYREQYDLVVARIADRIVDAAEHHPLGSVDPGQFEIVADVEVLETQFVVAVVAPTSANPPADRAEWHYGDSIGLWRPFSQAGFLPAAEYATNVAERLGSVTRTAELADVRALLPTCPAVVLIDPWGLLSEGAEALEVALAGLPVWALPVLVIDSDNDVEAEQVAVLADQMTALLTSIGVPDVKQVKGMGEFHDGMPWLITKALRLFLNNVPVFTPSDSPMSDRPSLRRPDGLASPRTGNEDR